MNEMKNYIHHLRGDSYFHTVSYLCESEEAFCKGDYKVKMNLRCGCPLINYARGDIESIYEENRFELRDVNRLPERYLGAEYRERPF